jgi:delta-aminolevulinic acid dehydratase/porphobilinogen synthase
LSISLLQSTVDSWIESLLIEGRFENGARLNVWMSIQVVLFPKVPDALKTPTADECYNPNGIVPRAIRVLKDAFPDLVIYTDVALDPYNSDGHDGICREDGKQCHSTDSTSLKKATTLCSSIRLCPRIHKRTIGEEHSIS